MFEVKWFYTKIDLGVIQGPSQGGGEVWPKCQLTYLKKEKDNPADI